MKKSMHFRSWLLPVFLLAAAIVAGSCSKGEFLEPDAIPADGQTRAVPSISISCSPTPKGDTGTYLGLRQTYWFSASAYIITGSGLAKVLPCDELSVHASNGTNAGFEIVTDTEDTGSLTEIRVFVRFTAPGYYHVTATTQHNGATYQETKTYCVVSRADKITQPTSVALGVPFDFSFNFVDPRYPDPTIEITESLFPLERFNNQYTILSNDGQGNYRLRIDQPGRYRITTGLGDGMYSAWSEIDVYFRPYMTAESIGSIHYPSGETSFTNSICLCDPLTHTVYNFLPYRVYFTYELKGNPLFLGTQHETPKEGAICLEAGNIGVFGVPMPSTQYNRVENIRCNWCDYNIFRGYFWELTIPEDRVKWLRVIHPDEGGVVGPGGGGIIDPLDPPGGVIQ